MALVDEIPGGSSIALDTDCSIYYVEEHERYLPIVEPLIDAVISGVLRAHVSVVSLLEVLVLPLREQRPDLVREYREILTDGSTLLVHVVDVPTSERAAEIRARYRLETSDSLIAAMAFQASCEFLVTNNAADFRRVPGLQVLAIDNYA